LENILSRLL